jgi:hypothetical protein
LPAPPPWTSETSDEQTSQVASFEIVHHEKEMRQFMAAEREILMEQGSYP